LTSSDIAVSWPGVRVYIPDLDGPKAPSSAWLPEHPCGYRPRRRRVDRDRLPGP